MKLLELLTARGYRRKSVEDAFERVRSKSREETLEKVIKLPSDKTTFVITFDPRLTVIPGVIQKHARTMMMDRHMKHTFKEGFQVAFKRHRNVKEFLCRARLYDVGTRRNEERAVTKGWRKCNGCMACTRSRNLTKFEGTATRKIHYISEEICCKDNDIIYVIECKKCPTRPQYVGKSKRCLMVRGREHIAAVDNCNFEGSSSSCKMYEHFTTQNHSSRDMFLFAIEAVHGDVMTTTVRERFWMQVLDTIHRGLNSNKT